MAAAYKVQSLVKLLQQVNSYAPKRSKISDGWIGDKAHAARKSEHNPDKDGSVDAIDITHDPANGCDCGKLFEALRESRDSRIQTVIHNGKIFTGFQSKYPFKTRVYTGKNKHIGHLHIDVYDKTQDDGKAWDIADAFNPGKAPPEMVKPPKIYTDKATVTTVQTLLVGLGYTEVGGIDGILGKFTRAAIAAFRNDNGLRSTDVIDDEFLQKLRTAPKRQIDVRRAEASPKLVTTKVPEAKKAWWTKITAILGGGASAIAGTAQAVAPANGYIEPLRNVAADVPVAVWFILVAVVAFAIWWLASSAEKDSVEAFRDGSRR